MTTYLMKLARAGVLPSTLVGALAFGLAIGIFATAGAISGLADQLARGWPRRKAVRAAVGHSLELETYRSLVLRQGLSRKQAVDAMLRLVTASAA